MLKFCIIQFIYVQEIVNNIITYMAISVIIMYKILKIKKKLKLFTQGYINISFIMIISEISLYSVILMQLNLHCNYFVYN